MTQWEGRRTQVDLRLSKRFTLGSRALTANVDLYNLFNASSVLGLNETYGSQWLKPISATSSSSPAILNGRFIQFSGELRF
jgi:hypothetical protein